MSLHSKWEGRIIIPSGDWTASFTDAGGTDATAIDMTAAETFYWSSDGSEAATLAEELQTQLNASGTLSGTFTVTLSAGELGTGKLTIASTLSFSNTWTSTDLRDLCGFTGNISSTTSATSQNAVQALWLPDCPAETPFGLASSGMTQSAGFVTLAPDGTYFASHGSKLVRNEYSYAAVDKAKTIAASETTTNSSYETFWLDTIRGEEPWAAAGRQLRYYADTDVDATYLTFNVVEVVRPDMQRRESDYDGLWRVRIAVVEN